MTNSTLTDRYIDAAMRSVPEDQRSDLTAELRASIADQIDARVADKQTAAGAEREVLTGLGDPDVLAADYADRSLWLIGPAYYLTWRRLLKFLLAIVVPLAAAGVAIGTTISGQSIGQIIGTTISVAFSVILNLCFWTTLVFAIVERQAKGDPSGVVPPWTLDDLPEPHESGARLGDLISTLVLLTISAGAILWDHFVGIVYRTSEGGWISFLADDLWQWWIAGLFVIMGLEIIRMIVIYAHGRYTTGMAVWGAVLNVLFAAALRSPNDHAARAGSPGEPRFLADAHPGCRIGSDRRHDDLGRARLRHSDRRRVEHLRRLPQGPAIALRGWGEVK